MATSPSVAWVSRHFVDPADVRALLSTAGRPPEGEARTRVLIAQLEREKAVNHERHLLLFQQLQHQQLQQL